MAKTDAPNYRDAGPATTQKCATCRFATANSARSNWCSLYQFQFDRDAVCDSWRPNVAAVREARQALAQAAEEKTVKEARSIIGRAGQGVIAGALTMTGVNVMLKAMREYMAHGNGGLLSPAGLRRAIASAMLGPWDEEDEEEPEEETTEKGHSYASTQFDMPVGIMAQALAYAAEIPPEELHEYGAERETHVTVKYGLRDDALPAVIGIAKQFAPIRLTFGGVTLFEREEFDVVKVDVESAELRRLHEALSTIPNADERPEYNPHLTIAYVKPGMGKRWVGDGPLMGRDVVVDTLRFSTSSGRAVNVSLRDGRVTYKSSSSGTGTGKRPASTGEETGGFFAVFKDSAGQQRWLAVSSSAYKDRDEEIVSRRALHLAVAIADATKERGPLRWWHMPGVDIGDCDFQMVHGRMLVESGTFRSPAVARKVARNADGLHLSIGFHHPLNEPQAGVYNNIVIFERSLVPAGLASNRFTALHVIAKENDNMATKEKLAAFRALLGPDADAILAGVETTDKAAQTAGVAFKERSTADLAQMTGAELIDYALAKMEKEAAEPAPEPAETPQPAGDGGAPTDTGTPAPVAKEAQPATAIHGVTINADALTATEFRDTMKAFAEAVGVSLKEVAARVDQPDPAVAQVQQQIADLTGKLKEAQDALAALADEQPRALKSGYRASVQGEPVADPQANAEAMAAASKTARTNGNHWGEFEDIAARLNPWMPGAQQQ